MRQATRSQARLQSSYRPIDLLCEGRRLPAALRPMRPPLEPITWDNDHLSIAGSELADRDLDTGRYLGRTRTTDMVSATSMTLAANPADSMSSSSASGAFGAAAATRMHHCAACVLR